MIFDNSEPLIMSRHDMQRTLTEWRSNVRPQSIQLNPDAEHEYVWFCTFGCRQDIYSAVSDSCLHLNKTRNILKRGLAQIFCEQGANLF